MARRKVYTGLIPNRRVRARTFGWRKEELKRKAQELAVLCTVDVALVVAAGDDGGGGGADVWESREGVLARYARARRAYLDAAELGEGTANELAGVRQGGRPDALARWDWDRAPDGVATEEEARRLLGAVDAAMHAAEGRRRALGLPPTPGDDAEDGVAPLCSACGGDNDGRGLLREDASGGGGDANNDDLAMSYGGDLNDTDTPAAQGVGGSSFAMGAASGNLFVHSPPALPLAMGTAAASGDRDIINNAPPAASSPLLYHGRQRRQLQQRDASPASSSP